MLKVKQIWNSSLVYPQYFFRNSTFKIKAYKIHIVLLMKINPRSLFLIWNLNRKNYL